MFLVCYPSTPYFKLSFLKKKKISVGNHLNVSKKNQGTRKSLKPLIDKNNR